MSGITSRPFGRLDDGREVTIWRLENARGASVDVLDYGCTIQGLAVPDARGRLTDVALGHADPRGYQTSTAYLGGLIGRVCGRISGGGFTLNGRRYDLAPNSDGLHLHGGVAGFDKRLWAVEPRPDRNALVFTRLSPDGEENYPGNLSLKATYTWDDRDCLRLSYEAETDQDTLVNLTNHAYFNLGGEASGPVLDQELAIYADAFLEIDPAIRPTGRMLPVAGTPFDFNRAKSIGRDLGGDHYQLAAGQGYDHTFVLSSQEKWKRASRAWSPATGIVMETWTTLPVVQFYAGGLLGGEAGKSKAPYGPHTGFCLETSYFLDAVNRPEFTPPILRAGERYHEETEYCFSTADTF